MNQFRRAIRLVLFLVGVVGGLLAALGAYLARFALRPPRKPLWATPRQFGMPYQDIQFPAADGVRLSGWFIPVAAEAAAEGSAQPAVVRPGVVRPAVVLVHGWPWNRLGCAGGEPWDDLPGSQPLELLPLAVALHEAGYHVLMFDLRNHGESAAAPPVTFGFLEANDVLGALAYLADHPDVAADRLGVVGFSMGANATIFSLPRTDAIRAAVVVQPTSPRVFNLGYSRFLLGPLGGALALILRLTYPILSGGLRFSAIDPVFAAGAGAPRPMLYVQGKGDPIGSVADVTRMLANTPGAVESIFPETANRFDGYQYLVEQPAALVEFFGRHLNAES